MNKKMIVLPMLGLGLVLAGGVVTSVAYAAEQSKFTGGRSGMAHERITLTDAQKTALEQARQLHQSGDLDGAKEVIISAGIKDMGFHGKRGGMGGRGDMSDEMRAKHEAVKVAVEADDYEAFIDVTEDSPLASLTEAQFTRLVEARELREAGDHEAVRKIMEELGMKKGGHRGNAQ